MKQNEMVNWNGKLEVAKKMLAKGIDVETVLEITGVTEEEIRA